jgi:hypothetical protein
MLKRGIGLFDYTAMVICCRIIIESKIKSKPLALGRKNYIFGAFYESANYAAIFYSLLGTCQINGINPY